MRKEGIEINILLSILIQYFDHSFIHFLYFVTFLIKDNEHSLVRTKVFFNGSLF